MLAAKLAEIDHRLLDQVCAENWTESETLEFKQVLPKAGDPADKLEFIKDVTALANTSGGDLVYGISEKAGAAQALIPLSEALDPLKRRLDQVLEAGVEPRIQGLQYHSVQSGSGHVLVLRVPASFSGPHRCIVERRFVVRVNSRTSDMAYDQLRGAFERTSTLIDRARQFREVRVSELVERSNWKSKTVGPICALHLIPLSAFNGRQTVDIQSLLRDSRYIGMEAWRAGGWNWAYNLDGLAASTATGGGMALAGVNQFYRTGPMESLLCLGAHMGGPENDKKLPGRWVTEFYREAAQRFLTFARELGLSGPAIIGATLVHVDSYEFGIGQVYNLLNRAVVDRDHLILPDAWVDDISQNLSVDEVMRPVLDILWQCFGAEKCLLYEANGTWSKKGIQ